MATAAVSGDREASSPACGPLPRGQDTGGDGRCLRGGTAGDEGEDEGAPALEEGGEGEDGRGGGAEEASLEPFKSAVPNTEE